MINGIYTSDPRTSNAPLFVVSLWNVLFKLAFSVKELVRGHEKVTGVFEFVNVFVIKRSSTSLNCCF